MDFMKMLEEYRKFANLSNEEKAEQIANQFLETKEVEIDTSRRLYQLSFMLDRLCRLFVKKNLVKKSELDDEMEVANAKAKEKFDNELAKWKEKLKSEILSELEKSE